jgi:GH25 family lysozyme M1 (1,4-beta-N-acetylmuramidase)
VARPVKLSLAVQKGLGAGRALFRFQPFAALSLAMGVLAFANQPVAAAPARLPGIDVSHYQGTPDWSRVKSSGVRFVIAKATEGTTFLDSQYSTNKQQLEALGIAFGAYHFANPDTSAGDAVAEADWYLANANLKGKNIVPVLDLERTGGLGKRKLKKWAKAWVEQVRVKLGVKAMIYAAPAFWRDNLGDTRWFADNGYRLWVAHWTTADEPRVPAGNWGGKGWTVWQYTSCSSVDGISGCVDGDRYNGSALKLLKIKNNR